MDTEFYNKLNVSEKANINVNEYSPLNLAYLGDAVFELLVRTKIVKETNMSVNNLHKKAKSLVKAEAQAKMYHSIIDVLTEDELRVLKRGRNAKSFTSSKNASISDYRHATGVEALFGYLFLKGETERMMQIFDKCLKN
jgi:ribonuclease III family protein